MLLHNLRFNQARAWSVVVPGLVWAQLVLCRESTSGSGSGSGGSGAGARWRYSAGLMRCDTWVPSSDWLRSLFPSLATASEAPRLAGTELHRSIPLLTSHHHHSTSHSVRNISWGKHLGWQFYINLLWWLDTV